MVKDVLALEINISGAEASSHIYRFLYVRTHGFQSSGQAVPPHRYIHQLYVVATHVAGNDLNILSDQFIDKGYEKTNLYTSGGYLIRFSK